MIETRNFLSNVEKRKENENENEEEERMKEKRREEKKTKTKNKKKERKRREEKRREGMRSMVGSHFGATEVMTEEVLAAKGERPRCETMGEEDVDDGKEEEGEVFCVIPIGL